MTGPNAASLLSAPGWLRLSLTRACPRLSTTFSLAVASTFQDIERAILQTEEVQLLMSKYGLQPEDIGLHSTRKGAATFISSASPVCHYVALMLRAGWSLNVQDAYLKLSQGGDCLVGRQLAGLPRALNRMLTRT